MTATAARAVFWNYLLVYLGYFSVLPVLPLLLHWSGAGAWFVGAGLCVLSFAARGASLLCGNLLHGIDVRAGIAGALAVSSAGFALLSVAHGAAVMLAGLAVAGFGISVNSVLVRVYIMLRLPDTSTRNTAFSVIQVAVNIAATIGPLAANVLVDDPEPGLLAVSALFLCAAAVVITQVPAGLRAIDTPKPRLATMFRSLVAEPDLRRLAGVSLAGWFLYGQLFSAFVLHVRDIAPSPLVRAGLLSSNGVLIVLLQLPVARYAARRFERGAAPFDFLLAGIGMFLVSFAILAAAGDTIPGAFVAIVSFTLAETLFTPFVNTACAALPSRRSIIERFNATQLTMAIGEALGTFIGGMFFLTAAANHLQALYWFAMSSIALLTLAPFLRRRIVKAVATSGRWAVGRAHAARR